MKKSFSASPESPAAVDPAVVSTMTDAEDADKGSSLALMSDPSALGRVTAPSAQIRLPQLKIRNPNSNCLLGVNEMPLGSITLDLEHVVTNPRGEATIIVLGYEMYYEDNVEIGQNKTVYKTLEAANAAGKSLAWGPNGEKPTLRESARAPVLVEKPADLVSRAFPFEYSGKYYALARWFLSGWAIWGPGKVITNKSQLELKPVGLLAGRWSLTTNRTDGRTGPFYKPTLRLLPDLNSPEFQAWVKQLVSGTPAA